MRKLWNRPDSAIWSLVTKNSDGVFNMNIPSFSMCKKKPHSVVWRVGDDEFRHPERLVSRGF